MERFDSKQDKVMYKQEAYDPTRYSIAEFDEKKDKESKQKEEDKAIGGNMDEHLIKEDNFNH